MDRNGGNSKEAGTNKSGTSGESGDPRAKRTFARGVNYQQGYILQMMKPGKPGAGSNLSSRSLVGAEVSFYGLRS